MARDNGGNTPLQETAGRGSPDNIQALLDAGTKINARANDGSTPLLTATAFGTLANIKALLDAGADVMARDNGGRTPLHWAVTCHLSPVNSGVNLADYKSCWPLVQTQNLKIKKAKRRVTYTSSPRS